MAIVEKIEKDQVSANQAAKGCDVCRESVYRNYPKRKLIHHSDVGLQYFNPLYTDALKREKIEINMTEKYDPYEYSIAEKVDGILKQELDISSKRLTKLEE